MRQLSDDLLLEAFVEATILKLDAEFVELIEKEINRRGLREHSLKLMKKVG